MTNLPPERKREIAGVCVFGLTLLLFGALVGDGYRGEIRRPIDGMGDVANALGTPGALLAGVLSILLGWSAHVLYCVTGVWGVTLLRHKPLDRVGARIAGACLIAWSVAALLHLDFRSWVEGDAIGGVLGSFMASPLEANLGIAGANVIALTAAITGLLMATDILFMRLFDLLRQQTLITLAITAHFLSLSWQIIKNVKNRKPIIRPAAEEPEGSSFPQVAPRRDFAPIQTVRKWLEPTKRVEDLEEPGIRIHGHSDPDIEDIPFDDVPAMQIDEDTGWGEEESAVAVAEYDDESEFESEAPESEVVDPMMTEIEETPVAVEEAPKPKTPRMPRRKVSQIDELPEDYQYPRRFKCPTIDVFEEADVSEREDWTDYLIETSRVLEETLNTFGIEARVTDVRRGPAITRFELEPAPGIKVSRFQALADDIALALKAYRVRVEAPIPGKGRVGIEVPNHDRDSVVIRELLETRGFKRGKGALNLALGKDIEGECVVADLATMPHMLVAGATGAGKTVCVKTLLASLLINKTPDELQLMLIDPKMVELSIFDDIPHLITPVVTDAKKAAASINWLIVEMEERYRLFAHLRVRNIEVYNESVDNGEIEMVGEEDDETESVESIRKLPYIVCIIDELADLMMLARAEVEDGIARLAQLARAVGIHLIIATQRPSVDVLTGVIKANFPTRVSFQVSSRVDSRCILDEIGAERLIGMGDMLYLPAGQGKPTRIQGAFVSDDEMNRLVAYLKTQAPPQYRDEIANFGKSKEGAQVLDDQDDELFDDAVRIVMESGQASISMVQRRLRVGYTRAARLIDMMELKGIVGPHIGSKAREILVTRPANDEVA
jgi:S-DNA-T family DNA segregation ATPase FtsK/SpoIIIE